MEDKDLDRLFRDAFHKAEEIPDDSNWNIIETRLNEQKNIVLISKRKNWWAYATAAIVILGLGYFGIAMNFRQKDTKNIEKEITASVDVEKDSKSMPIPIDTNVKGDDDLPRQIIPATEKKIAKRREAPKIVEENTTQMHLVTIETIPENQLVLSKMELNNKTSELPKFRQVTEIDDIKPLIEPEEEMESMLASNKTERSKNLITSLLNTISEKIDPKSNKEIHFYADEEGSFGINIINSMAKNRNKKRK